MLKRGVISCLTLIGFGITPVIPCVSSLNAQERTAGSDLSTQMTWTALKKLVEATDGRVTILQTQVDQIVTCGKQGLVYSPGSGATGGCISQAIPTGTISYFALSACPTGWRRADGTNGTVDVRGAFIRVLDSGANRDPTTNRGLATWQGDAIRNITGRISFATKSNMPQTFTSLQNGAILSSREATGAPSYIGSNPDSAYTVWDIDASRVVPVAPENRPLNIALLACQKT